MGTKVTNHSTAIRLAADVGGTFTDVVLEAGHQLITLKVPTDVANPEQGILRGVQQVLSNSGHKLEQVNSFIHGTTLATNALIERKGATTALITTEGFRDSLEIGYENRFDQYDLMIEKPQTLVPRHLRWTITERMNVLGQVLRELDEDAVRALVPKLNKANIEAVAVGLLHSYANPAHERKIRDILQQEGCQAEISLSSEVCPEVREYERLMTSVCNAYVQPLMARYLRALQAALGANGFQAPLFLMTSGGGMTTLESAIRFPIRLVESGPSGGAVLASKIAQSTHEDRVLSFDMGGTTAKICLIDHFKPRTARNFEIARAARFRKGSGMPVRIPVVEMIEIGAGGGSIAHVDSMGRLAIGPKSAGSQPGPACYQRGGDFATVTDADVVLGKIDANAFAQGTMQLDVAASESAISKDVASPLDIQLKDAAFGMSEMVEENMANAARIHSVEHGSDLTKSTMIAFGGAGPLHAVRLAEKLNIKRIIIPANSSVGSALGFLWAPMAYELIRSRYMTLNGFDAVVANELFDDLAREAVSIVSSGAPDAELKHVRTAFMRYVGQGHEIEVPVPNRALGPHDRQLLTESYETLYRKLYGRTIPERDIEIMSWALVVSANSTQVTTCSDELDKVPAKITSKRMAFSTNERAYTEMPVYWRPDMVPGASFDGPAMVAEAQTTTFVTAQYCGYIDAQANLVLQRKES